MIHDDAGGTKPSPGPHPAPRADASGARTRVRAVRARECRIVP
jgi:hypothetical protein